MDLKLVTLCLTLLQWVRAFPAPEIISDNSQVLHYDTANMPQSYNFYYDTSDGSSRMEQGQINNPDTPNAALSVQGTSRWVTEDGSVYEMSYKAGKKGYRTIIKKIKQQYLTT